MTSTTRPHVVLLSSPGMGHVIPLVELAKRFVFHRGFRATLITFSDLASPSQSAFLSSSLPDGISSLVLPPVTLNDLPPGTRVETKICTLVVRSVPNIHSAVASLRESPGGVAALLSDIFCAYALGVAAELGIPRYLYFTSNCMTLSLFLHLPKLHETTSCEYRDLPEPVRLPGCVPLNGVDLIEPAQDRSNPVYTCVIDLLRQYWQAQGFLVNSFEAMEPETAKVMRDGNGGKHAPVWTVGPFIRLSSDERDEESRCIEWLDSQPRGSVLYVSFGSGGTLSLKQTEELALGLEMSQKRFLWAVRRPSDGDSSAGFFGHASGTDDPLTFLPEGFLKRTQEVGKATSSWIPQVSVLEHSAVAGFMTHCGWNSTLESICNGVPLIAWPLYAEQRMNAVMLHEATKVALRPKEEADGLVTREAVAEVVAELMDGEKGKAVRQRAKELQVEAAKAVEQPGGSSFKALEEVSEKWKK